MAAWPTSLPTYPLLEGYSNSQESAMIRTPMETGPAKQRRRYTKDIEIIECTFNMSTSQKTTFRDFFNNTLGGGADSFDWTHPETGNAITARFRSKGSKVPFSIEAVGDDLYKVSVTVEVL